MVRFLQTIKKSDMKKLAFIPLILFSALPLYTQGNKSDVLVALEKNTPAVQESSRIAILKTSSRLFRDKSDLTSVILVIPSGDTVSVIGTDSTYLQVAYRGNDGYIELRHAVISAVPAPQAEKVQPLNNNTQVAPTAEQQKYQNLTDKYGPDLASKLIAGKLWRGVTSEMVTDSWGKPLRINRVISATVTKEEWVYVTTWLYFENNILLEWGPTRK
jgi:hypothetical protein